MEDKYEFAKKYRDQLLRCSSCGSCRAVCPVFGITKRPAYNARGKMMILKEVMEGTVKILKRSVSYLRECGM